MTVSRMPEEAHRDGGSRSASTGAARGQSNQVFPPRVSSDSEAEDDFHTTGSPPGRVGNLLDFLQPEEDDVASGSNFYEHLQALKAKNRQSLLELGTLYQAHAQLEVKPNEEDQELESIFWKDQTHLDGSPNAERSGYRPRSGSLNGLFASNPDSHHRSDPNAKLRSKSATLAWATPVTVPKPFNMTIREAQKKAELLSSSVPLSTSWMVRQSHEEAECQRKFRAFPVPAHVYLPLYEEMKEQNETRRSVEMQKRRELLLSTQKPFSFVKKEERKKEEIRQKILTEAMQTETKKAIVVKKIPKSVQDPTMSDKIKEAELYRKIRIQMRAKDLMQKSVAPISTEKGRRDLQSSTSLRTQAERLSFLQENLRFQPKTNPQMPDFDELYKAFQREVMKTRQMKEATRNKPFNLSKSNLRSRPMKSLEVSTKEAIPSTLRRSHSLSGLSSLSSNTLPVYITDSTKRRESAIRSSLDEKQCKENEHAHWMEIHKQNSQAMLKSVTRRAKVLDPHKPLQEIFKEKLKQNCRNDQKRTKEYISELKEMKKRVQSRPFLFEQITKRAARKEAERRYISTLQEVGLSEDFVREKGELTPENGEEELDDHPESPSRAFVSASNSASEASEEGDDLEKQEQVQEP